eukprot:SAG11_NODE_3044_length_2734_cov_24.397723_1_plen_141_part_00
MVTVAVTVAVVGASIDGRGELTAMCLVAAAFQSLKSRGIASHNCLVTPAVLIGCLAKQGLGLGVGRLLLILPQPSRGRVLRPDQRLAQSGQRPGRMVQTGVGLDTANTGGEEGRTGCSRDGAPDLRLRHLGYASGELACN